MLAYNITNSAIMLVIGDQDYTVPRTSIQAQPIMDELRKPQPNEDEVARLVALEYSPEAYSDGQIRIMKDGAVIYNDEALPTALADKVCACYADGVPFTNVLAFFDRLNANPSKRAVEELYTFLEHKAMPITPDGHFLAYKGINEDGYSCTGGDQSKVEQGITNDRGQIRNFVGDKIRVKRNYVDDDKNRGCSSGLHAGSLEYATGFGVKCVIVKIDPADVVSIPTDCHCQKLRTCAYEVTADYQGKLSDSGVNNAQRPYDTPEAEDLEDIDDILISVLQVPIRTIQQQCQEACEAAHKMGKQRADAGEMPDSDDEMRDLFDMHYEELNEACEDAEDKFVEAYYEGYRS